MSTTKVRKRCLRPADVIDSINKLNRQRQALRFEILDLVEDGHGEGSDQVQSCVQNCIAIEDESEELQLQLAEFFITSYSVRASKSQIQLLRRLFGED
ncbi:MAG: hypothetical protein KDA87_26240 [Planctomycetales bacterium]|nr:hypothetical protein [Planctomycetales bacterium]